MQKALRLNDGHAVYLGLLAKKDGAPRGYLSKRSSDNTKWHPKWFALLQNMLFYFENDSSSRPAGLYLLEGCLCDRAPSPKPKDPLEKQVGWEHVGGGRGAHSLRSRERLGNSEPGQPLWGYSSAWGRSCSGVSQQHQVHLAAGKPRLHHQGLVITILPLSKAP